MVQVVIGIYSRLCGSLILVTETKLLNKSPVIRRSDYSPLMPLMLMQYGMHQNLISSNVAPYRDVAEHTPGPNRILIIKRPCMGSSLNLGGVPYCFGDLQMDPNLDNYLY